MPRWLDRHALAQYINVKPTEIRRLVARGILPKPSYALGPKSPRFDRLEIDKLFGDDSATQQRDDEADFERGLVDARRELQRRKERRARRPRN